MRNLHETVQEMSFTIKLGDCGAFFSSSIYQRCFRRALIERDMVSWLASRKADTICHPRAGGDLRMANNVVLKEIPASTGMTVGRVVASITFPK